MLKEALQWLQERAEAAEPTPVDVPLPAHHKKYILPSGESVTVEGRPKPKHFQCDGPDAFADLCAEHGIARYDYNARNCHFVGIADDDPEKPRVILALQASEEWMNVLDLLARSGVDDGVDPKDAARVFRSNLRDTLAPELREKVCKQLGQLSINSSAGVAVNTARGADTMGQEINKKVAGDLGMPDELLKLKVRPFLNPGLEEVRATVTIYVEPNMDEHTWRFIALPDTQRRATDVGVYHMHGLIQAAASGLGHGLVGHI